MDDIKQRLKDASEACVSTYEAWRGKMSDHAAREALQDAVHELRKVAARLEIDLAVSDRKQQGNEPIPIPSHRASRRGGPGGEAEGGDDDFNSNAPRNNRPQQGGRSDNRPERQPVQIRQRSETEGNGPSAAKESAAEGEEGRKRPLSLRRTSDSE